MTDRLQKITFGEMREMGVRGVLVYCADYTCSHSIAINADEWPDELRLSDGDDFTARMFDAINGMLLDMLAAVARKDYDDRRRRQAQGIAKAKAAGEYKGRPEDTERNAGIATMLASGASWT